MTYDPETQELVFAELNEREVECPKCGKTALLIIKDDRMSLFCKNCGHLNSTVIGNR